MEELSTGKFHDVPLDAFVDEISRRSYTEFPAFAEGWGPLAN
jgi:hypothetical protein